MVLRGAQSDDLHQITISALFRCSLTSASLLNECVPNIAYTRWPLPIIVALTFFHIFLVNSIIFWSLNFAFVFFRILMEMEKNVSNGTEFVLKCAIFVWCHQSTLKIRSNKVIEISFLHSNSFWLRFAGGLLIFLIFYTLFDCFELVSTMIFEGFWWMLDRIKSIWMISLVSQFDRTVLNYNIERGIS